MVRFLLRRRRFYIKTLNIVVFITIVTTTFLAYREFRRNNPNSSGDFSVTPSFNEIASSGKNFEIRSYSRSYKRKQFSTTRGTKVLLMWFWHPVYQSGRELYLNKKCEYSNCYLTDDRNYLKSITDYDAILFDIDNRERLLYDRPEVRSPKQKYIAIGSEAPNEFHYGMLFRFLNDFFNLTFTFRLDSDVPWRYFIVYDKNGRDIGPALNVKWLETYKRTRENIKSILRLKSKPVAWLVSHCETAGKRELYVEDFRIELTKLDMKLDTYGRCGNQPCNDCLRMFERTYYFYLSFENTIQEDYVTEKVLNAVHYTMVPIVWGGANYSRFLPPGSYIDAYNVTPKQLAEKIKFILSNLTIYEDYFRWTNHYTIKYGTELDMCHLCKAVNNETIMGTEKVYKKFNYWWMGNDTVDKLKVRMQAGFKLLQRISNSKLESLAADVKRLYDLTIR